MSETEEAALEAQLSFQMEDNIDSNRNDNFLSENVGELERDGNAHLRAEEERPSTEVGHSVPRITQRMARRPTSDSDRAEEGRPGDGLGRSMLYMARSVACRPMSRVSVNSATSRTSAEAHISARLKELRVRHLEQGRKLKQQEDDLRYQVELQKAKDDAEEARLEAQLRAEVEDDFNADRRNDFLHEGLGEPGTEKSANQRPERAKSSVRFIEPVSTQSIEDTPQQDAPSPGLSTNQVTWIDQLRPAPASQQTNIASAFAKSIPRLVLPTYSGKPAEWPRWMGLFKALVHDQPSLSDAERMAHLQASLSGQAQEAVSGMLYDGNLYQHALKTLQDRFGQSADVIRVHLDCVFSAQALQENDTASLTTFQSALHCAVTLLKSQGYEADLYSTENLRRAVVKLPQYLRREWADLVIDLRPRHPSLLDLDTWPLKQVKVELLCAAYASPTAEERTERPKQPTTRRAYHATAVAVPTTQKVSCVKCGREHALTRCREFKALPVERRMSLAFEKGLCLACLTKGHMIKDCSRAKIFDQDGCRRRHHRLLHRMVIRPRGLPSTAESPANVQNVTASKLGAGRKSQASGGGEAIRAVATAACSDQKSGNLLQVAPETSRQVMFTRKESVPRDTEQDTKLKEKAEQVATADGREDGRRPLSFVPVSTDARRPNVAEKSACRHSNLMTVQVSGAAPLISPSRPTSSPSQYNGEVDSRPPRRQQSPSITTRFFSRTAAAAIGLIYEADSPVRVTATAKQKEQKEKTRKKLCFKADQEWSPPSAKTPMRTRKTSTDIRLMLPPRRRRRSRRQPVGWRL